MKFNHFGRQIGWRLLLKGVRSGARLLLVPVSSTRYFEFPFVEACLPVSPKACLDASSPKLFGLWLAKNNPTISIQMLNPDPIDNNETKAIARNLNISNIRTEIAAIDCLSSHTERYDCIWSISVVEHVYGDYEDDVAMQLMYQALKPGGRLIVTIPVDQKYWIEYRDTPPDGPVARMTEKGYFTQRFYDQKAIQERLISPIGKQPSIIRWWGEKTNGRFLNYCQRWIRDGYSCTVDDPREFSEHYQEFATWNEMPGVGVCGLMFEKA
jgi:SAM-dependent methyltransferase